MKRLKKKGKRRSGMRGENVEPLDDLGSLVCVICKTSQAGAL